MARANIETAFGKTGKLHRERGLRIRHLIRHKEVSLMRSGQASGCRAQRVPPDHGSAIALKPWPRSLRLEESPTRLRCQMCDGTMLAVIVLRATVAQPILAFTFSTLR